jgi:hypothetical protein
MSEKSSIQMSQGYDVLPPKTGKAYPILCEEWDYIKKKVGSISEKPNIYHTIGSILLGACISTLVAVLTGTFSNNNPNTPSPKLIIAWAIVAVTLIVGLICLYFSKEQRKVTQTKASDVLNQMQLIERRYQSESNNV